MATATAEWCTYGGWRGARMVTDAKEALDVCADIEAHDGVGRVFVGFTSGSGHFLAIGLGSNVSRAMYWESVDPPYFQSPGPHGADERIDFAYDGQHTEFPGTVRIRRDRALQALVEFMKTELMPDCIEWEQTRQRRTTTLQHEGACARARARQVRGYCDGVPEGPEFGLLTERLRLRLPVPSDVEVVRRIHQDPAAVAHNPSDALANRDAAEDLLRLWLRRWQRDGVGYWMVTGHTDPTVLGFCGVKPMRLAEATVLNLFYRFDPAAWGRGLATEAVTAVIEWAVRIRPEQQLVARIRPGNTASVRVATKAGLVRAADLDTDGEDGPDQIWVLPADHAR